MSALTASLCGCMADTRHLDFISIGNDGWKHTDTLTYTITPLPEVELGGVSMLLHTEGYNYENIALNVTIRQDTILRYSKLHTYLLSHNQPKNGVGRRCDYTLPVGNITLCDTLPTTITLTHRLDQSVLTGIREVGIRIGAPLRQPDEPVWKVDWH